jgi:hypothetical protein
MDDELPLSLLGPVRSGLVADYCIYCIVLCCVVLCCAVLYFILNFFFFF